MQQHATLELIEQITSGRTELQQVLEGVTPALFNARPSPHSWSMAEALRHLVMGGQKAITQIDEMTRQLKAEARLAVGPFRPRLVGRISAWLMEPPYRVHFKAASDQLPTPSEEPMGELVTAYLAIQEALVTRLNEAHGLDWNGVSIKASGLRFTLGDVLLVMLAHQRRHLYQMAKIRAALQSHSAG